MSWVEDSKARIAGRPVVVSVSGGKDSTAVCLLLKEMGILFRAVHMVTGWEHPETVKYLAEFLPAVIGEITYLRGRRGGMEDLIRHKGMFPSRVRRFCTQELKTFPFRDYFRKVQDEEGEDPISALGIRRAESASRREVPEWEFSTPLDGEVWRPIAGWSFDDVISMHKKHGVRPNPLYLAGATRVGCWPCINSRKAEIRRVALTDPARIARIEALEAEVTALARARAERKGREPVPGPTFFQAKTGIDPATGKKDGRRWPIARVVEWSKTRHGGKLPMADEDLFDDGRAGCARWGFCDTPPEGK